MSVVAFKTVLKLFATVALVTGAIDFTLGLAGQQAIGALLSDEGFRDPVINSQIRYLGTIWLGFGIMLYICSSNIHKYADFIRGALAIVFLGGLGRLFTLGHLGWPETSVGIGFVVFAITVELIGMPLLFLWHHNLRKPLL